jgi:hypothetical protein
MRPRTFEKLLIDLDFSTPKTFGQTLPEIIIFENYLFLDKVTVRSVHTLLYTSLFEY